MRKATCMSLLLLGGLTFLNANDLELEERLKAIMILFEKSETSLQDALTSHRNGITVTNRPLSSWV